MSLKKSIKNDDKSKLTVSFDPGKEGTRVAVILECPGSDEAHASPKHPAAGVTGKNLHELLDKICEGVCEVFKEDLHYDETKPMSGVMVCNAHTHACYEKGSNKVEPKEVLCQQVKFVGGHIKDKDLVICFGKDAAKCYDRICSCAVSDKPKAGQIIIKCCHIGNKALNRVLPSRLLQEIQVKGDNPRIARLLLVSQYVIDVVKRKIPATTSFANWLNCRMKVYCEKRSGD